MTDSTVTANDDNSFRARHIGLDRAAHAHMLAVLRYPTVDALIDAAVPRSDPRDGRAARCPPHDPSSRCSTRFAPWPTATKRVCR